MLFFVRALLTQAEYDKVTLQQQVRQIQQCYDANTVMLSPSSVSKSRMPYISTQACSKRVEEACWVDQACLQILESRVAALEDEEIEVYELSVAQVDSYEMRCQQTLEDLYAVYLQALQQSRSLPTTHLLL